MKKRGMVVIILLVLLILVGLAFGLANAQIAPPTQKMEQAIPDDHIPR